MDLSATSSPIEYVIESPCGFFSFDTGLSEIDLATFEDIDIARHVNYHWFCEEKTFEENLFSFWPAVGDNSQERVLKAQECIQRIAKTVMASCGKKHAWFLLKASVVDSNFPSSIRWHMDGSHYRASKAQVKFCVTLRGATTQFSFLPVAASLLRQELWRKMNNSSLLQDTAKHYGIFEPQLGEGVWFLLADPAFAALHTEPLIEKIRLFFSIVPCEKENLEAMYKRIQMGYLLGRDDTFFFTDF